MRHTKLILVFSSILALGYSSLTFAKTTESEYFLDHTIVNPGKSISVNYTFPSADHVIECQQDVAASHLGSVEWKFKNVSFKGQIGDMRSFTLMREDSSYWWTGEQKQTAEASGKLVFTNLDDTDDLYVTCSYTAPQKRVKN